MSTEILSVEFVPNPVDAGATTLLSVSIEHMPEGFELPFRFPFTLGEAPEVPFFQIPFSYPFRIKDDD